MLRRRLLTGFGLSAIGALCLSTLLLAAPGDSPIADAAMRGDAAAVRTLLKDAADVNAAQGDGMTALHWAAMHGDADLTSMLLYAGANPKAATRIGAYTPLYLAAERGHAAVIDALLKGGADPKVETPTGATPLMVAAESGHVDAVQILLDHGADVNAAESVRGETPLMFAAASDRAAVIDLLVKHGASVKATTKVIDLASLSKDPKASALFRGNPPPPPKEGPAKGETPAKPVPEQTPAPAAGKAPGARAPQTASAAKPGAPAGAPAKKADEDEDFEGQSAATRAKVPGVGRQFLLNELVSAQGGMTPLLFAARQGYMDSVQALLKAGADVNQVSAGDHTSPLLIAVINGNFDIAQYLLDRGANPNLAADNGAAPLYAALNVEWAPKALYPQPRAYQQQKLTYLDLMKSLLGKGADPNARLTKKVWYSGYSFDLSGVDEIGATAFWRAAYASDVDAMKLLVAHGADPNIPTMKPAGRPRTGDGQRNAKDVSGLPPIPIGGPGVPPLLAASGQGYGEGFAANAHRFAPTGMLTAVKYLVEVLHADVNAMDHEGNTALHNAAARGDNEMILYLVSKGANVKAVNREGKTTADMANGPVQRIQPFPDTIALLEKLGAKNNHKCVSC